jgi:hypothetical protein
MPPFKRRENFARWRILVYVVRTFFFVVDPTVVFIVSLETTPGVYQASGYGDLAANKSMWFVLHLENLNPACDSYEHTTNRFWFFAARNNPETAPLITWLNGGVSGPDRHSILSCSRIGLAWKLQHDWFIFGEWPLPHQ